MPRQSKRRKLLDETSSATDSMENIHPEPETVTTKPKRNVRGRRGVLQSLPGMPIDILIEVLYHLRPVDLLHIGRTTKAFRNLLMVRSSAYIWKEARRNVQGLPEPFAEMNEPVFASLCFEPVCTLCFKSGVRDVVWEFRARLCNRCKATSVGYFYCMRSPVPHISADVVVNGRDRPNVFLFSDVVNDKKAWDGLVDEEEKNRYIQQNTKRVEELRKHATRCKSWFANVKNERAEEIEEIKQQRHKDVLKRLKEMGYAEDVTWLEETKGVPFLFELHSLRAVRQPKPLTDRTWQKIGPAVIEHITTIVRPRRLHDECKATLKARLPLLHKVRAYLARPYRNIFPTAGELARLPEVKAILDPACNNQYPSIESFNVLIPQIPDILANWKTRVQEQLDVMFREKIKDLPSDVQVEDLALTQIVYCNNCHTLLQNSNYSLAVHDCKPLFMSYIPDLDVYSRMLNDIGMRAWNPSVYYCSPILFLGILGACGKDRLATVEELDQLDPRFTCKLLTCQGKGTHTIYNWRAAGK
ncbi:hypothetical protein QCA50_006522 [Cerrena zonata]|uniref:F-box domain-containing protein n=1 Tax=Cerrena zonata TaxID=2478898 RepID=A0AAW0GI13_9APHY